MAGYSGTPLPKKLGIKEGHVVGLLNAPNHFHFDLGDLPDNVDVLRDSDPEAADVFIVFASHAAEAQRGFERAMTRIPADGSIWVAWPKKASGVETDLDGNLVRELFLETGMVDNKVCAIDETWSGLRFVVRVEDREGWPEVRT